MMTYKNPILRGNYPDPSICRVEEEFYLVNSSMEYVPGVPLFTSKDLVNWKQQRFCLDRSEQLDLKDAPCSGGIYAPTIRHYDGMFYMVTTDISKGNFVVSTDDIRKGFSDPVFIDIPGIDPSLYFEDGKCYMQTSCMTYILQAEIDIRTGRLISKPEKISFGCGGRDVEGPHVYKIGEWYYLFCAEGGTREGHMETVQRSYFLNGPYEPSPYMPLITNRNKGRETLQSVGHADLVDDPDGNWWIVALATRPRKHLHHLGRETVLVPVNWTRDGWPIVENGFAPEIVTCDWGAAEQRRELGFYDDFSGERLRLDYCSIREFLSEYCERLQCGNLRLTGNGTTLSTSKTPVFLGVRQKEYCCSFETRLECCLEEGGRAGLAVLMDNFHHMEIGIVRENNQKMVYAGKTIDDMEIVMKRELCPDKNIVVGIDADEKNYSFYYRDCVGEKHILGSGMVKHLSTEISNSPFVGVYCGMFVEKKGIATFHFFSYQEH